MRSILIQQFFTKEASPDGNSKKSSTQKESSKESCKESGSQEKSSEEEVRNFNVQFLSIH